MCKLDVTEEMVISAMTLFAQANVRERIGVAIQEIETTGAWVRSIARNTPSLTVETKSRPSSAPIARY